MIRVNGFYLYELGTALRALCELPDTVSRSSIRYVLFNAHQQIDGLLNHSIFRLTTCRLSGTQLLDGITKVQETIEQQPDEPLGFLDHFLLTTQAKAFETVLSAELNVIQLYLVSGKGGYDLGQLLENGMSVFPSELAAKVPEVQSDVFQATRCIAFELPNAAAFHLHRVNEAVLRKYYDHVTGGLPHPEKRSVLAYIDAMKNHQVGDKVIFGALATLNNLHRNPVLHPDQQLESVDDAVALLGIVITTVTYMLKPLPMPGTV